MIGTVWAKWDFQILDVYYKQAVQHRPPVSPQIVYVTITDDSYDYFGKNVLDRTDMARVNDALAKYGPAAVAYDIIFARPSQPPVDQRFAASLRRLGTVYLPIGFDYTEHVRPFAWEEGIAYSRLRAEYLKKPSEHGRSEPLYAVRALMQLDAFSEAAFGSGHISISSDADGVFRHMPMLLKIDVAYVPTLSLAMFLHYAEVPFEDITIDWGKRIVIPAQRSPVLDRDVTIPIDLSGRAFIPYAQVWHRDFEKMPAHTLLQFAQDPDLQGNLLEFFEGKFVFVGDISTGISDIGKTPLEEGFPLIGVHTSLLNGLLTNSFYQKWTFWRVQGLILLIGVALGLAALLRSSWCFYVTGSVCLAGVIGLTWFELRHLALLPVVTVSGSVLFVFFGLLIGLHLAISKDQAFIRNAFAKYVPEEVVAELLAHPERLQLGGEERILSVLFSDIEGFTTISENLSPTALVALLNDYLTEMTAIILAQGGIIDKYEGDAIMAEFGAPLALPDHAERAVRAGLHIQRRLHELRQVWTKSDLPALQCRVGINTGAMLVGNMGSQQVFDYTAIGDAVNLAARLESANKFYRTSIMVSESTHERLPPNLFRSRVLDVIKVQGKMHAVKVFEIYGEVCDPIEPHEHAYYQTYEQAFVAYLGRDFPLARQHFEAALALRPDDPAVHTLLARLDALDADNLPDDWDGSVALTAK